MPDLGHVPLLPTFVDSVAAEEPHRVWASTPRDPGDLTKGWRDVSWYEIANAVNRVALRIVSAMGAKGTGFPTIAYIGPNDLRYIIFVLATIKTGYQALLISPRNSIEGQLSLFERTSCHTIAYTDNLHANVAPWLAQRDMQAIVVGSLDDWLDDTLVPAFAYSKTLAEAEMDPFVVLHTSGSTGLPKPIVVRMGMIALGGHVYQHHPYFEGNEFSFLTIGSAKKLLLCMPAFHAAGIYISMMICMYMRTHLVLHPPTRPLSSSLVQEVIESAKPTAAILPPSIVEEMAYEDDSRQTLASLDFLGFGGGPVAKDAGDLLVKHGAHLVNFIASTENAPMATYIPPREDWHYFHFDDEFGGYKWKPLEGHGDVCEQIIVRKDGSRGVQGCFYTFPDLQEWSTRDLFKRHPTKPHHWSYYGRADNIIVFSNGEKLNPVDIEDRLQGHPEIAGALVVGQGRLQPGLLLEPAHCPQSDEEARALIERVWPLVFNANKETVAHGQIGKELMAITRADKPLPRAGKGTIQRGLAFDLYQDEIDALYASLSNSQASGPLKVDVSSEKALMASIEAAFGSLLSDKVLDPDTDFFSAGLDSMQVLNMSRALSGGLKAAGVSIDASLIASRVIYLNPTPRRLAASIFSHLDPSGASTDQRGGIDDMEAMLQKYTHDLPLINTNRRPPSVVLLTGSTGAIGSYLLDILSKIESIDKIICLNRAADGRERQTSNSSARGLDTTFAKAEFIHADLSQPGLGIRKEELEQMSQSVDVIIHNQWQVDFNLSLASFEPHVRGVRNLVDFSLASPKHPRITFISTIATISGWQSGIPVPEAPLSDYTLAEGGYGQSKLISSLILEEAARRSGVHSATVRVGQVAGPLAEKGQWNRQEWLPTIIASSAYLGVLPDSLSVMDTIEWVPTEIEAGVIVDIALSGASGYFHGVNPQSTTWSALLPTVKSYFGERINGVVSFAEWVERLRLSQTLMKDEDVSKNPGVKLLDFYEGMAQAAANGAEHVQLDTRRTQNISKTLRELKAVQPEWMALWLKQWAF